MQVGICLAPPQCVFCWSVMSPSCMTVHVCETWAVELKNDFVFLLQCESSLDGQRGRCWCVSSWNGKKILGSTDLPAEAECP